MDAELLLRTPGGIWIHNPCKPLAFLRDIRSCRLPVLYMKVQPFETKLKCYTRAVLCCIKEAMPLVGLIFIQIFVFAHIGVVLYNQVIYKSVLLSVSLRHAPIDARTHTCNLSCINLT